MVDLNNNKIDDPEIIHVFSQMPNLAVLNLMGNPVIRKITNYRKTMISSIKSLTYLDDRPVSDNERLAVEAWVIGGAEAETEERARQRQEETDRHNRSFEGIFFLTIALRAMQEIHRQNRIANGEDLDAEVVFPPEFERFRQEQLDKIKDVEEIPVANETEFNTEIARSAEMDEIRIPSIVITSPEDEVPIRSFTQMTTSGENISLVEVPELEDATQIVEAQREQRRQEKIIELVHSEEIVVEKVGDEEIEVVHSEEFASYQSLEENEPEITEMMIPLLDVDNHEIDNEEDDVDSFSTLVSSGVQQGEVLAFDQIQESKRSVNWEFFKS